MMRWSCKLSMVCCSPFQKDLCQTTYIVFLNLTRSSETGSYSRWYGGCVWSFEI